MKIVEASGLGLRTRRGWVYRDVDLTAEAGELHAVTGPPGSGRTSLLLTLAGASRTTRGSCAAGGTPRSGRSPGCTRPTRR